MTETGRYERFETVVEAPPVTRDCTMDARITAPDGRTYRWWAFTDGVGCWRLRWMPDQAGRWRWRVGGPDGPNGEFECVESELPGVLHRDARNPIWFGFTRGPRRLVRSLHVGDRFFADGDNSVTGQEWSASRRTAFLDWAGQQGYTMLSVGSCLLNRDSPGRGQGWHSPALWDSAAGRPRPSEYHRLETGLADMAGRRMVLYPFAGFFGQDACFPNEPARQQQYLRYTIARLGPFWNIVYNVAGPEPLLKPAGFHDAIGRDDITRLGNAIAGMDPFGHALSVHNMTGDDPFRYHSWQDFVTLQGGKGTNWSGIHAWLLKNHTGTKPVYAQECLWPGNKYHTTLCTDDLRRKGFVYLLSATTVNFADNNGDSSSGYSGTLDPSDRVQQRHDTMKNVWDTVEQLEPWLMEPRPDLVDRGFCLAADGGARIVYLPHGGAVEIARRHGETFVAEWINPRAASASRGAATVPETGILEAPDCDDWLVYLRRE